MRLAAAVTLLCVVNVLPARAEEDPKVSSESAVVLDMNTGAEVWAKDADEVRAIASTTKIFVALAVRRKGIELDGWTEITQDDVKAARGGARTRLDRGQTFQNIDLLRAMLMSSDNRAPTALGRAVGLDLDGLLDEMNAVAKDLGLENTTFTSPTGMRGNVSTAREMALAIRAVLEDEVLVEILQTDYAKIVSKSGYAKLDYGTTNSALRAKKYKVLGGKTGFTRKAGYCFVVGAEIADKPYVMAFLGGEEETTRFSDFNHVSAWIESKPKKSTKSESKKKVASKKAAKLRVRASGTAKK